jgi:hypothetical protein
MDPTYAGENAQVHRSTSWNFWNTGKAPALRLQGDALSGREGELDESSYRF